MTVTRPSRVSALNASSDSLQNGFASAPGSLNLTFYQRIHASDREIEILQERGVSRVGAQVLKQGVHAGQDQAGVTSDISSV